MPHHTEHVRNHYLKGELQKEKKLKYRLASSVAELEMDARLAAGSTAASLV